MRISEVAAHAGVNVQTLRYYERRGLLEPPPRTPSGYRIYPRDTVRLVRFIKRVQELGFSLSDVEGLLRLGPHSSAPEISAVTEATLAGIRTRIQDLQAMDTALRQVLVDQAVGPDLEERLLAAIERPR